jgi:hypothetical protein
MRGGPPLEAMTVTELPESTHVPPAGTVRTNVPDGRDDVSVELVGTRPRDRNAVTTFSACSEP